MEGLNTVTIAHMAADVFLFCLLFYYCHRTSSNTRADMQILEEKIAQMEKVIDAQGRMLLALRGGNMQQAPPVKQQQRPQQKRNGNKKKVVCDDDVCVVEEDKVVEIEEPDPDELDREIENDNKETDVEEQD